jgi:PBP1b-binding outer membrane lipoprotein LpoB
MMKVAVTVAVLALGLAGCARDDDAANQDMTANEFYTENAAENDLDATNAADNALLNAEQAIENVQDAADNAAEAVEDAQ